jgi:NitT/TauT family transport system permease protein
MKATERRREKATKEGSSQATSPPLVRRSVASSLGRLVPPSLFLPLLTFILVIAGWEIIVRAFHVPQWEVPTPSLVAKVALRQSAILAAATFNTAESALIGFAASLLVGVGCGMILGSARWIERSVYPFTIFLQTVPLVALAPLLVLWFGPGLPSVAISAFIVSLFPVIANTFAGMRSVDPALRDLFRLYGASRTATLFKLRLPHALPDILTGLRIAAGLAVIGAIVGEFVAGLLGPDAGLGVLILSANRNFQTPLVVAAVILASLLGLILFLAVQLAGYLLLRRWHASAK